MRTENDLDYGKPLKPTEIAQAKKAAIPLQVIEIVNDLIARNWDGEKSIVKTAEIVEAVIDIPEYKDLQSKDIHNKRWLDFEVIYESVGWNVVYNFPNPNEEFIPYFQFMIPKKTSNHAFYG